MATASSSGEVRRRKNPKEANPDVSYPSYSSSSNAGSSKLQNHHRPESYHHSNGEEKSISSSATNSAPSKKEYDEYAWFAVFLTALCYFIVSRGGNSSRGGMFSSFSKPYHVVSSSVAVASGNKEKNEKLIRSIFYIDSSHQKESSLALALNCRLEVIISSPPDVFHALDDEKIAEECSNDGMNNHQQDSIPYLSHLSSTAWVHDEELGRGYLLLADVGRSGRIWRWEVGGGPITIGRSLHMESSGCRSGLWVDDGRKNNVTGTCPENLFGDRYGTEKRKISCLKEMGSFPTKPPLLGSASLAVELTRNAERSSAGKNIIIAEWGERRIVRVEGETGARTPLVVQVPHESGVEGQEQPQWRRVLRPNHLTYTPFGDLLFSDNLEADSILKRSNSTSNRLSVVYCRKEAVHVPPIPTDESRNAHSWMNATNQEDATENVDILFQASGVIEGMALGVESSALFVLVAAETSISGRTKTVYKVFLNAEEDGLESNDGTGDKDKNDDDKFTVFYRMNAADCESDEQDSSNGSKLAVDEKGTIYLIACPSSVTLLDEVGGHVVGTLALDKSQKLDHPSYSSPFTSISFGEDGYLYITSPAGLMRIKSRVRGMAMPTNLVVPPPLKMGKDEPSKPNLKKT